MVLSNKKLKQKLRAEIADSLVSSAATPDNHAPANINPDPDSKTQSLKKLLDSVTQKPRLSKREKKRRRDPVSDTQNGKSVEEEEEEKKNDEVVVEGEKGEIKKKKKRKREKGEFGEEESEELKEAKKENTKKNNKKKKKQKKYKNKKKNKKDEKEDNINNTVVGGYVGNEELNKGADSQVNNGYHATKVYVGGIPYSSAEIDIKRYFESCGTIDEVDCMTFPDTGRFRGIAILTFRTEGAAKRALSLDGSEMDGLLLKIQPYKASSRFNQIPDFAPKILEGYNRIYLGNLSWDITEEDLRKLFSDCKIESIRFGMNKETGEFKGYAHVDFTDSLSLTLALKLDQEIVCGRPVKISCAVPRKAGKSQPSTQPTQTTSTPFNSTQPTQTISTPFSSTQPTQSIPTPSSNVTDTATASASAPVSGKIRRRTCYECGEKGHLSSACPKKAADTTNSTATT